MNITGNSTIGEVVAHDNRTSSVFKIHNMNYCCGGKQKIEEVCRENKIDVQLLLEELADVMNTSKEKRETYNEWSLSELADYIEKTHHRYCDAKISEIKSYLERIVHEHGLEYPELLAINKLFLETAGEMTAHMKKEELILFPFIRKMVKAMENGEILTPPYFGTVENPIAMMEEDHSDEGTRFDKIRELSKDYEIPQNGCYIHKITIALLKQFEEDLHQHIHLENNILFPKAIELEKELRERM